MVDIFARLVSIKLNFLAVSFLLDVFQQNGGIPILVHHEFLLEQRIIMKGDILSNGQNYETIKNKM